MSPRASTSPLSLLRALVLVLCITLGGYLLYFFPGEVLGSGYLYLVIAALLLYSSGAMMALAGSERTGRFLGLSGLGLMGGSMLLLAVTQTELLLLAFLAPFAALLRVHIGFRSTLIIAFCAHLLLAFAFHARWQLDGIFVQTPLYMIFTLSSVVLTHLMIKEAEARSRLAALHDQLQATQQLLTSNAVDKERLRISRDLHDSLGHHLTALSLQLEVASHHAGEKAEAPIAEAMSITKSLLSEVRDVVGSLRAESRIGLRTSLEHLVASVHGRIDLDIDAGFSVSRPEVDEAVFRIVQEILTNYARHSEAASLSIRLRETANEWIIASDDSSDQPVRMEPGRGLLGMQERVEALGGELQLETECGLRHLIHIPKAAPT